MSRRNHLRESSSQSRQHQPPVLLSEDPLRRRGAPAQHHPSAIEDRIAIHQRDLQTLLLDNQRLAATHVALKQELSSAHQDLRHLAAISQKIKAERDAEVREVLEKSVKVEAEYRTVEALKAEIVAVRDSVEKMKVEREELGAHLSVVNGNLARAKSELSDLPDIRAQMENIAKDIEKGRAAVEVERKNRKINDDHGLAMDKYRSSMMQEIERLRGELANAQKRAMATAAAANPGPGYGTMYANNVSSGIVHGGGSYTVQYPMHQVQSTDERPCISPSSAGFLSEHESEGNS